MPKTFADGQLPASAAALFTAGQDQNYPSVGDTWVSLILTNTSGATTETVVITFKRQGGTARRIARFVLLPNEQAVISGLPMQAGDSVLGVTTNATTVDYLVGACPETPLAIQAFDANGALRQVNGTSLSGAVSATSLAVTAGLTSSGATGAGIGYATGAGGTVTQGTSRSTGVTLNKLTGQITTHDASLAAGAEVSFTVTNSTVAATDTVLINITPGGTGKPSAYVSAVGSGSFEITLTNFHAATADTSADVINFTVVKGVAA